MVKQPQPEPQLRNRFTPNIKVETVDEDVSEELIKMARVLKSNTVAMHKIIESDNQILDTSESAVSNVVGKLHKENTDLQKFNATSWKNTLMIWLVLLFAILLFIFTFGIIRGFNK